MSKSIIIILLSIAFNTYATRQSPDILEYKKLTLDLLTGWGHPSPLQTYYYQNEIEYPFKKISTGNYRGHIATWKIANDSLYLTQIEIRDSIHSLANFNIVSNKATDNSNKIFANWFSGVIECRQYKPNDEYELKANYFFRIRYGVIVEMEKVKKFEDRRDSKLGIMIQNYTSFYYRQANDTIHLNGKKCLLNTSWTRFSPIFQRYNNDFLKWPYNWENKEKNGVPICNWAIANDSLFLKDIVLQYGLMYDTVYTHKIELNILFDDIDNKGKIHADWVNGIFLIEYGGMVESERLSSWMYFKTAEYTFIRVSNGKIEESFTLPEDFDFNEIQSDIDPKLLKLINEYK